ncbi:ATP-binding protein [Actinoplanes sp. NPDC024001]|uniref:PAS domain-containing sensor histidine kinase n=1 Tax=Actinoplanes sp. NPDC024001 TaxID=3154598 RepID=UPI0033F306E9
MTAHENDLATAYRTETAGLDRLTRAAARMLRAPMAEVCLPCGDPHPASRYVMTEDTPLVVADLQADPRFAGTPDLAAYAGYPLHAPDGTPHGAFFVADIVPRDWTDEDLANLADLAAAAESELALRAAHGDVLLASARLQAVLDSTHDAFVSMGADGRITAWNVAAERLFGWSTAEALGRRATELMIPPHFRDAHDRGLARVRRTGSSALAGHRLELSAIDRSGREFPIEMTLQMHHEHGQPVFHAFLHDISARTAALTELAQERAFLQALLNSLDTGVAACDSDGRLAQFNSAMRRIHGIGRHPVGAESWASTYHLFRADGCTPMAPDEVPLARAYAGETVQHEEMVIHAPDRPARRFLTNARPIDTTDGRRLGAVVAMHEITEAHRAEMLRRCRLAVAEALSEATSAREAAVAAAAAVATELNWACAEYWEVAEDQECIERAGSWSRPGAELDSFTGAEPLAFRRGEGVPGTVWASGTDLWSNDLLNDVVDAGRLAAGHRLGLRTAIGLPVHSDRRVAGVLAFFTDTGVARDDDVLSVLHDIAGQTGRFVERRRAEDLTLALAAARRDFDRVIQQVNDCFWTVEIMPDGYTRGVYLSPGATGVFGGEPGDPESQLDRMPPDDQKAFLQFRDQVIAGKPAEVECRVIGFDGQTRWVWTRAVPREEDGHLYVDGISTNTTERRELADQQTQQVRRLQELDRMKDELVAVVSHELRNPVAIIAAYTESLLEEPELAGRAELAVIERTSAHLVHLVEDLLDLARLENGNSTIDPRPLRPDRLLRQAVQEHQRNADVRPVTLVAEIGALPVVPGDAARLRQVLDNLLSNAIKYTPAGGTVTVTAEAGDTAIVIAVTDTGIGIPADEYPQLFNRFFRASTATSRKIKGTGLGLAVTKAIVEAHGGTIGAAPGPVGGTRFTVTLPR